MLITLPFEDGEGAIPDIQEGEEITSVWLAYYLPLRANRSYDFISPSKEDPFQFNMYIPVRPGYKSGNILLGTLKIDPVNLRYAIKVINTGPDGNKMKNFHQTAITLKVETTWVEQLHGAQFAADQDADMPATVNPSKPLEDVLPLMELRVALNKFMRWASKQMTVTEIENTVVAMLHDMSMASPKGYLGDMVNKGDTVTGDVKDQLHIAAVILKTSNDMEQVFQTAIASGVLVVHGEHTLAVKRQVFEMIKRKFRQLQLE